MLKRCLALLLIIAVLAVPVNAGAVSLPVSKVPGYSAVVLNEDPDAQLISYEIDIDIQQEDALINESIVIRNSNTEKTTEVLVAIPQKLDNDSISLNNLRVVMDGKRQSLRTRRNNIKPEDTSITDLPNYWSVLTLNLKPGEYKLIDISYSVKYQSEQNTTRIIYMPIGYLKYWTESVQNARLTVHFSPAGPYVFEPNPSVLPAKYDNKSISWQYSAGSDMPDYIRLYYRPIEQIAPTYISRQAPGDKSIRSILDAYSNKSYNECAGLIDELISSQGDLTLKNELLFLKALALKGLYRTDEVMDIYSQLEGLPMFGEFEGAARNKIVFEKYHYMKQNSVSDTDIYTYLDNARDYVVNNTVFLNWLDTELSKLPPPETPEPSPTATPEQPKETDSPTDKEDEELVKTIRIFGRDIPVEVVFFGILLLLILIPYIIGRSRRKKHRYIFR